MNFSDTAEGFAIVLLIYALVLLNRIVNNTWGISRMLSELIGLLRERGPHP
jgi:hypothetical protein